MDLSALVIAEADKAAIVTQVVTVGATILGIALAIMAVRKIKSLIR